MARVGYAKHATQVNVNTHPDDGTSPVGSTEWNEAPSTQGMLGFSEQTISSATLRTIASGVATVYDTITVVTSESSTTDTLDKLATTNTSEYDLIYLFGNTGHTITMTHTASPNAAGQIVTVSGANEVLSATVPTILIRKDVSGTAYWYGYGGGGGGTPTDITVADSTDTTCFPALFESATGDLAPKTDAGITYNAGTGVLTATGFAGPITGNVTGDASGVADNVVGLAELASGTDGELFSWDTNGDPAKVAVGTNNHVLTSNGAGAAPTFQATQGGGATIVHQFTNTTTTNYAGTASSFGTVGAGDRDIYIKKIDTNNEGVFTKIWKNGSAVEVQIA